MVLARQPTRPGPSRICVDSCRQGPPRLKRVTAAGGGERLAGSLVGVSAQSLHQSLESTASQTSGPAPALVLVNLHKAFGQKRAVDNLSLQVPTGSMFGLVGPNGAGKTTTLSMATGLLRPDYGTAFVLGHDVWSDPAKAKSLMGVLPDGLRMFDRLTGKELLTMVGQLHGVEHSVVEQRADNLLSALSLSTDANTLVCDYSAGMTKKIGLATALIHAPRVLLLDEPFEAVDPVSGQAIRAILRDFVANGGTVVMSSHVMELVESLCDALAIVAQGRILAAGTVAEVRAGKALQERFVELVGAPATTGDLSWLRS